MLWPNMQVETECRMQVKNEIKKIAPTRMQLNDLILK